MSGQRTAARILIWISILTLVVSVVGFIATLILNAFVLDKYDAYGEVPIPGSSSLHLPAGEVTVSFHTQVIGSPGGGGLPVPELKLRLVPPDGVSDPKVIENFGSTTTVNNDAHVPRMGGADPSGGHLRRSDRRPGERLHKPHARVRPWQFLWVAGVGVRRAVRTSA